MKAIRNAAKALIIREGCLLALKMQDANGVYFILPGGGQEPGETLADTVRRECYEEIAAEVAVHELRFVREFLTEVPHRVEFIFRCTLKSDWGVGRLPDSGQLGVVWLPLAELQHTRFYPSGLRTLLGNGGHESAAVYLGDLP
ncbi:MAG: NUDIX domain-containing protein [Chloroflexota bacterium]|nr:NUDIX domain-containing protein [Chloroflexota bacterium]